MWWVVMVMGMGWQLAKRMGEEVLIVEKFWGFFGLNIWS